jgi:hypothetical protein
MPIAGNGPPTLGIPDAVIQMDNADDTPEWKIAKGLFRRRSVRELRQHLFRIPLWVSRRVNQQRSTVVSPPRAILNIFPKVEDGERPRLPDRQRFQFWRRLPQTR